MAKHLALFALLLGIPFVTAKANFLATSVTVGAKHAIQYPAST